jgi:undecaprenyl-diphosphatase
MATAVWFFNRKAGLAMYVLASLLGFSRIVGGVHYPIDVLAGALVGIAAGYVVVKKLPVLQRLWRAIIRFMRRWVLA